MPSLAGLSIRLRRRISAFTIDWVTGVLVAVALVVQVGAVALADTLRSFVPVSVPTDVGPEWGVVIGVGIIAWTIVGLVAWRVWERLPALVQRFVWAVVAVVLLAVALYGTYHFGLFRELAIYMGIVTTAVLVDHLLSRYDLDWLTFDALGIGLGIVVTALFGVTLPLVVIIPLLVVSATWDYLAVVKSEFMEELARSSAAAGLPNYLIIPNRWRVDFDAIVAFVRDSEGTPRPEALTLLIGIGDFMMPAILTTAAWVGGAPIPAAMALLGTLVGFVVIGDITSRSERGLPALPYLNTGALAGYVVGLGLASL